MTGRGMSAVAVRIVGIAPLGARRSRRQGRTPVWQHRGAIREGRFEPGCARLLQATIVSIPRAPALSVVLDYRWRRVAPAWSFCALWFSSSRPPVAALDCMPRSVAIPVDRRACTPIETVVHHHEALRFAWSSYQRRPRADCGIPGCQRLSKIEISSYIRANSIRFQHRKSLNA